VAGLYLTTHDPLRFKKDFLRRVRGCIVKSGLRRVRDGKAYHWVLPEPFREVRIL
jgi:hypothetical protein